MIATRSFLIPALAAAALLMAGCEKLVTGEEVQSVAVSENESGGYGPVLLALTPEMSPVAINFHARHGDDPSELEKWNSYHATLSRNGRTVAIGMFNLNHTGTIDSPQGSRYLRQNMLILNPAEAGDYELVITPTKPAEMKLYDTQVKVRRNVQDSYAASLEQPAAQRALTQ
jgi:hypothetical protein